MTKDAYRPCPCGSGKKIKFCCKESASDIEKISRLIDANQPKAARELVDRLLRKKPDLQCLYAFKLQLTITATNHTEANETIDGFLKIAPANPAALAALAIRHAADWDSDDGVPANTNETWRDAVGAMQRSLSNLGRYVSILVMSALTLVARRLHIEGKDVAAFAHFSLAGRLAAGSGPAAEGFAEFLRDDSVSLLAKTPVSLPLPPENATWADDYNALRPMVATGAWADAVSALEGLARTTLGEPVPRRAIGLLRACLGEEKKAVELLRASNSMDNVPDDEAVIYEAVAQLLDQEQSPSVESLEIRYEIDDADEAHEKLLAAPHVQPSRSDVSRLADDEGVTPIAEFLIVDRPPPSADEPLTLENTPRGLAIVQIFAKQGDRDARIEVLVEAPNREQVEQLLAGAVGESVLDRFQVVDSGPSSVDVELLGQSLSFPQSTPSTVRIRIEGEANQFAVRQDWTEKPKSLFDGKTPREVAGDPAYSVRLRAAIRVLEAKQLLGLDREFFQQLRESLGLERKADIVCRPGGIGHVPPIDFTRVDVTRLSDQDLVSGFQGASALSAREAAAKFGNEILRRGESKDFDKLAVNLTLFRMATDDDIALEQLLEAQRRIKEQGRSPAGLMIQELSLRVDRHEQDEFFQTLQRLMKRHMNEPGVRDAVRDVLTRLGLVSDGAIQNPGDLGVADEEANPTSKIWTPEDASDDSATEKSEIWVPD